MKFTTSLNMRRAMALGAVAFLSSGLHGQEAGLSGRILGTDSTTALTGVAVELTGTNWGAATNGRGRFSISNIPAGQYELRITALGYQTQQRELQLQAGEEKELSIYLREDVAELPEVTVMTGGLEGVRQIPGSAQYLSPRELQKFSYTDINRSLRQVPGVNFQEEDGFGLFPNIGMRGSGVNRSANITLMEDGILTAPAPYAAPAAYYFPTAGRMQAIEVMKGSSQIKYGPYTTGGALNLISTPIPDEFSGRMHLTGGSFGGRQLHSYIGNSHRNFAYLVETFQWNSEGFKTLPSGANTGFNRQDYLAKFRVNTNPDAKVYQSLTFKIGQNQLQANETYLGLTETDFADDPYQRYAGSQRDEINTHQNQFSLTHVARFSPRFNIQTTAYRTEFSRNWYKLDKVADTSGAMVGISSILDNPGNYATPYAILQGQTSGNDALSVKANNRSYYAQGVQTQLNFDFGTGALKHDLDIGARYHEDQIDRFQWVDDYAMASGTMQLTQSGAPGTESNRVESAGALALYLQDQIRLGRFTVTPGLRYENISMERLDYGKQDPERAGTDMNERSNQVEVWIPGLGADYRINRHWSAFGGIHKGFAPPGSREGTRPEESINYELGARMAQNALSGQVVIFYNDYQNLLGTDLAAAGGGGSGNLFNGGAAISQGVEFMAGYDLLDATKNSSLSLPVNLSYTYTDAFFQNNFESDFEPWGQVNEGDKLPYLAQHQLTVMLGLEARAFRLQLSTRYTSAMRTRAGQGDIPQGEGTDAYLVTDASVHYRMHSHISLFANATNITDEVYAVSRRPAGLRPGMPRAFNLGIKADF